MEGISNDIIQQIAIIIQQADRAIEGIKSILN